ncbi:MAG: hypothetical protein KIT37_05160 [Steroidobacteraceae bacterium]|nr:hypothetical protein [Steroidobacteraceae bacterium]
MTNFYPHYSTKSHFLAGTHRRYLCQEAEQRAHSLLTGIRLEAQAYRQSMQLHTPTCGDIQSKAMRDEHQKYDRNFQHTQHQPSAISVGKSATD